MLLLLIPSFSEHGVQICSDNSRSRKRKWSHKKEREGEKENLQESRRFVCFAPGIELWEKTEIKTEFPFNVSLFLFLDFFLFQGFVPDQPFQNFRVSTAGEGKLYAVLEFGTIYLKLEVMKGSVGYRSTQALRQPLCCELAMRWRGLAS